jgi:hypothetical protein
MAKREFKAQSQEFVAKEGRLVAWINEHLKDGKEGPRARELIIDIKGSLPVLVRVVENNNVLVKVNEEVEFLIEATMLSSLILIRLDEIAKNRRLTSLDKVLERIGISTQAGEPK